MNHPIQGPYRADGKLVFGPAGRDIGQAFGNADVPRIAATAALFAASWDMLQSLRELSALYDHVLVPGLTDDFAEKLSAAWRKADALIDRLGGRS